ncbi:hypothetical protein JH26_08410 [Microvirga sp. BSC39]|nr:hypothetical protein JH26_08410 [Microvirga sp. BSC39]
MVRDIVEIGRSLMNLALPGLPLVDPTRFRLGPMPGVTIEEGQHPLQDGSGSTHCDVGKVTQAEVANVGGTLLRSGIRHWLICRITLRCVIRQEAREGGANQNQDQDHGNDEANGKANNLGEDDIPDDQDDRGGDEAGAQSLCLPVGLDMRRNAINDIRGRFMITLG